MKIKNIELFTYLAGWREWSFLKISTDQKLIGWSECTDTFKNLNGFIGILKDFEELILGEDPTNIKRIVWKLKTKSKSNPGSLVQRVISAVENSLWDIKGKKNNKPVYGLFGKKTKEEIEIYWSHCGTTRVRTPENLDKPAIKSLKDVRPFCEEINETDFKVIKTNLAIFNNGPEIYMPGHQIKFKNPELELKDDIFEEIYNWIKEFNLYLNKDISIAVDLNFNFKEKDLIRIAKSFKKFRIKWLEIDSETIHPLIAIKKMTNIPIITGETIMNFHLIKNFIDNKCIDYVSIDLPWTGLDESKKIADYCNSKNLKITTHNYNGYLGTLMAANFAGIIKNFYIGEMDFDECKDVNEIFTLKPIINGRFLSIPDTPGWGCDLKENKLNKVFSAKI